jgi:hypothetical protein
MKRINQVQLLALEFNVHELQTDLVNVVDWKNHFNTAIYEGDWSGAPLRAIPGSPIAIYSDPTADNWQDSDLLNRCAHFQAALAQFQCPLLSVRLLRLAPGAFIKEHRDYGLGLDVGEVRLHLVVATNPEVECRIDGVPYHWAAGECWYADFGLPHFFANRGDTERVHMVLDCKVNDWLRDLLTSAASPPAAEAKHPAITATPDWFYGQIQNDPDLQSRLFAITNPDDLLDALSAEASQAGYACDRDALRDIMRQNQRSWIERHLP